MPFALFGVALLLVVVGIRGSQTGLFCLLKQDFTGQGSFLYWMAAVLLIGMLGYIPKVRVISDALIVLLIVSLFIASKGGLFSQIQAAIGTTSYTPTGSTGSTGLSTLPSVSSDLPTLGGVTDTLSKGQQLLQGSL